LIKDPNQDQREMEIEPTGNNRWVGLAGYGVLVLGIAALLVFLLTRFSTSLALAIGLVAFMIAYMLLMGYLAGRKPDRKE